LFRACDERERTRDDVDARTRKNVWRAMAIATPPPHEGLVRKPRTSVERRRYFGRPDTVLTTASRGTSRARITARGWRNQYVSRKAEIVSIGPRRAPAPAGRASRVARPLARTRRAPFGARLLREGDASAPPSTRSEADSRAWQLIHDDPFDRAATEEEIARIVRSVAARSATPYVEVLRRLVGIDDMNEVEAQAFFARVVEHRRVMGQALGRSIHIRVAALDLLTARTPNTPTTRRDSHPIIVTPSLLEKAFEVATADAVTGLPQRSQFMNLLRHELRQRKRRSVCVAFIDLDGFKRVNDRHGHARGDEVLRALARSARGSLREGDVLARIGGDEFAVLLLDATPAEADAALRRLRDRFEALTAPLGTSFSAGIAVAGASEPAERVVMRADQAMYRQKRARAALSG
jgi:diguanylate cyclase (GGDEF)-like protein